MESGGEEESGEGEESGEEGRGWICRSFEIRREPER